MNPDSPLARLARACAIEDGYHNIWGHWHALSEHTARRLLQAMGLDVRTDVAIELALNDLHQSYWRSVLPPVCVRRDGETVWLPLNLSEMDQGAPLHWHLVEEGGSECRGDIDIAALELLEEVDLDGQRFRTWRFVPPWTASHGYHTLSVSVAGKAVHSTLIVTPSRCWQPDNNGLNRRDWGLAVQLYGVRSERNWGMGDLGDLARAVNVLGEMGVDAIGINPLHALYTGAPDRCSPYSPSNRRFANALYLDVEAIPDFADCASARAKVASPGFQSELSRLRSAELVDYVGVARLKWPLLRELFEHFRSTHLTVADSARQRAFRAFQNEGGDALRNHAVFEVLHEHMAGSQWPPELLDARSPTVGEFARVHEVDIEFREYLQWQLRDQIAHAQARARSSGMRIGLYRDLAVGSDAFGSDVWGNPGAYAQGVSIGAPPDDFNLQGQVWGLPPWLPQHLQRTAYAEFVSTLRANMCDSGALRIDHVIGLMRQFWVPAGGGAADGAFVRYPLRDLLGILALESSRAQCVIVGEDLGTVPDELRAALHENGLLSYCVLYFSKHWHGDHSFISPQDFPSQALVTASTHDLPTLCGYWQGRDLELRDALRLFPSEEVRNRLFEERAHDRDRLLRALEAQGLLPESDPQDGSETLSPELITAIHRYIGRSPAALTMVQMEDVFGQVEQANVPGTVDEQPNWRRRLDVPLEQWTHDDRLRTLAAALSVERGNKRDIQGSAVQ